MADSSDVLDILMGRQRQGDPISPRSQRSFSKVRSVVGDYSRLISGKGYDFYAFPSLVEAVAHAKTPLIPMMISIVPPENYPTGETSTREIPSPSTTETSLTTMQERFTPVAGPSRTIRRVVPVDTRIAGEVADLQAQLENTDDLGEVGEIQQQIDSLISQTRLIEVEVPENTPEGRESQVRNTRAYLDGLQTRYEEFQNASRDSRSRLNELNTPITGPNRLERSDPYAELAAIEDARKREVADDLFHLRKQARLAQDLPPLFMYINPTSFSLTKEHIVSDGNKVRDGFSIEFWGQQQVTLSASGSIGAFYVDSTDSLGRKSGGLAVSSRKGSYAYQQFLSLYQTYRNNGYIYNAQKKISLVGAVSIFYDGTIYTGSFNSFSITHSEDTPFSLQYNFDFTVRFKEDTRR